MKVNWKWLLTGVAIPLVAAAIAGVISLAASGRPRIEIVADSNTYQLSPQLSIAYEQIRTLESADQILAQLKTLLTPSDKYDSTKVGEFRLFQISRDIAQAFTNGWGIYAYSLRGYNSQTCPGNALVRESFQMPLVCRIYGPA